VADQPGQDREDKTEHDGTAEDRTGGTKKPGQGILSSKAETGQRSRQDSQNIIKRTGTLVQENLDRIAVAGQSVHDSRYWTDRAGKRG
jgi:hypothetical protein